MSKMKSLGPLGVSPASGYGYVAGSNGARFFGEGTINPKFFAWHAFFQIKPGKSVAGVLTKYYVGPIGSFIHGTTVVVQGLDVEQTPAGAKTFVYIECTVADGVITVAEIKGYSTVKPLFEPEEQLAKQTKVRHFLGLVVRQRPFPKFGHNLVYPVIQSSFSVPIVVPACVNGFRGVLITTA